MAVLPQPAQAESSLGIQLAFLPFLVVVDDLVDGRQRLAHGHRIAADGLHATEAGIDLHPRPNGRLRQVRRRDVTLAGELIYCCRQFTRQFVKKLAASSYRRAVRAWTADQHDRRGQRIGTDCTNSSWPLSPHRPSANNLEACEDCGV